MLAVSTSRRDRLDSARDHRPPYHHGNLRERPRRGRGRLGREHGPGRPGRCARSPAGSGSPTTRRTGTSPTATSWSRRCAGRDRRAGDERRSTRLDGVRTPSRCWRARLRLAELGRGYVEFALAEPGLFRVVFSPTPPCRAAVDGADARPAAASSVRRPRRAGRGRLPGPEHRPGAEITCWAAVHGFAALHLDGPLRHVSATERESRRSTGFWARSTGGYARHDGPRPSDMDDLVNDR